MVFSSDTIALISMWIVNTLFFVGLWPQIALNYRLKSASGISDLMLFGLLAGYTAFLFYVFGLNFPLSYKVIVPLTVIAVVIMVIQRFYYDWGRDGKMFFGYLIFGGICLALFPVFFIYPIIIGNIMGWVATAIWGVYQIPQGVKVILAKSTRGFSFAFASIMALGVFVELISAVILDLPIQTIISTLRGLAAYGIYCILFYMYRHSR